MPKVPHILHEALPVVPKFEIYTEQIRQYLQSERTRRTIFNILMENFTLFLKIT